MSLTTILLALVPVAVLFVAAARLAYGQLTRAGVGVATGESAVLTLLAALWFGSLGHGGWWLVFLLLGILVAGAERGLRSAQLRSAFGPEWRFVAIGVARYLAAGALLAWRLS